MLNDYQIQTIEQVWILLAYLVVVSYIYWRNSRSIFKSAHGMIIFSAFLYAVIISRYTEFDPPHEYYWPLIGLVFIGIASAVFSITAFKGKKWMHLLHLGTLTSGFFVWFVGSMAIAHDWV
jgi:H+/Cl- antiporter ClcA